MYFFIKSLIEKFKNKDNKDNKDNIKNKKDIQNKDKAKDKNKDKKIKKKTNIKQKNISYIKSINLLFFSIILLFILFKLLLMIIAPLSYELKGTIQTSNNKYIFIPDNLKVKKTDFIYDTDNKYILNEKGISIKSFGTKGIPCELYQETDYYYIFYCPKLNNVISKKMYNNTFLNNDNCTLRFSYKFNQWYYNPKISNYFSYN